MDKAYILDTNVILDNPNIINSLKDAKIIIPSIVIEEVDRFKNEGEIGFNARLFSNMIYNLGENNYITENNSEVIITFINENDKFRIKNIFGDYSADNEIIYNAIKFNEDYHAILYSNDINVIVKARALSLNAFKYNAEEIIEDDFYTGCDNYYISDELMDILYRDKIIKIDFIYDINIYPHMFLFLKRYSDNSSAIIKVTECGKYGELFNTNDRSVSEINPRNIKQKMLIDILMDKNIPLITVSGKAGTGKTLLALAAALELKYDRILLTKPVIPHGRDIGYLKGNKEEKLKPWLQSYYDNLEFLLGENYSEDSDDLKQLGINIDALTYVRGRTLPNTLMIVDECQNLTKSEIKTIITRIGHNSKLILMGDTSQIDSPYLDKINNGLSYVIDKFKDNKVHAHIHLDKSERSELADIAADIL